MKTIFYFLRKIVILALFTSVFFGAVFIYFLWKFSPELPNYTQLKDYNPSLTTRVFTSDGVLLDEYFIEERLFVPVEKIPKKIIHAFISAEDKNFYKHYGIDIFAIFRAAIQNILNYGSEKRLVGASTITQQVVKNFLLSNELSYERKIKEIILAIRIEKALSKNSILELYLNDIYLGYGSYGIAAASLNYFNKSLIDLNLEEIAYLAALPKAPNNYHPIKRNKKAIDRRNWVLDQMYKNKLIKRNDLIKSKSKALIVEKREDVEQSEADYFKEEVRKRLYKTYGQKTLYEEGLIVKTTLNNHYQKIADMALINGLLTYDQRMGWRGPIMNISKEFIDKEILESILNPFPGKWNLTVVSKISEGKIFLNFFDKKSDFILIKDFKKIKNFNKTKKGDVFFVEKIKENWTPRQIPNVNGAIIVIDPHSGKILALRGGFSFKLSEFNRATQAKRQPGSAFKPFVYMAAIKEGFTPSTLILDAPFVIDQGPGLPKWKPSNYTKEFYGLGTMRIGVEKSRNLMTIRLADKIGMEKIYKVAKDFNVHHEIDGNLSMALGAGVVTLENLTNAYAMIVNGGKEISPRLIQSVSDKRGKIIYNQETKKCLNCLVNIESQELPIIDENIEIIIDPSIAYQMTSMLEGVVKRGTGKRISELNIPLAGKTGTTNDNYDAWFVGFSPDLVVGIYVGYDQPKTLGYKETGSRVAVPIFKNFMETALSNKNKIPFRISREISFVKIDPQTGLQTDDSNGIMEAFKIGTEPFNNEVIVLDSLSSVNRETLSGTGNLLLN